MLVTLTAKKLAGLALLFSVGVAGAAAVVLRDEVPAAPAADGGNGTGTVIGGGTPDPDPDPDGGTPAPVEVGVFTISGRVSGLVPGVAGTLPLTVTNPNPWPIQVLTLDTGVRTPLDPACPAGSLRVGRYAYTDGAPVTAPARGTVRVEVPVELADSKTQDQSGCAGTAFPLTFSGTARTTS